MTRSKSTSLKVTAAATLLCVSLAAYADILAGVGWGGPRQVQAVCYLFNTGPGTVNITSKAIYPEFGTALLSIVYDSCGNSISPGAVCAVVANVPGEGGNACRIVLAPSGANVKGRLEIRDNSREILSSVELR